MILYCDGCRKKDGKGGWGLVIESQERIQCYGMGYPNTTNNRMEMMGCLFGLQLMDSKEKKNILFISDSEYLVKGYNQWMRSWVRANWSRKNSGGAIKNIDLWKQIHYYGLKVQARGKWVRGHAGNRLNELADKVANFACYNQDILPNVRKEFLTLEEAEDYFR